MGAILPYVKKNLTYLNKFFWCLSHASKLLVFTIQANFYMFHSQTNGKTLKGRDAEIKFNLILIKDIHQILL